MCDCLCAVRPDGTLFAKSSDRPPGEAQVVEAFGSRPAGGRLHTQYLTLPDRGAPALVGARPTWLWGFEHGVNAHRVAIGNEQLWTVDDPSRQPEGLTGMDLVRLGLERGRTAVEALEVMTVLIDELGQGGVGERDAEGTGGKAYFSSFLVADPTEAWVLETSARSWAARPVGVADGGVALSNRISLSTDWARASADVAEAGDFDRWRRASSPTAHADRRLAVTRPVARAAAAAESGPDGGPRRVAATLRHHGARPWGAPGGPPDDVDGLPPAVIDRLGTGVSLCMHLHDIQATTSALVTWLPRDPDRSVRGWVAPGNPCVSVFVPTFGVDGIATELADPATWARFARLRRRVEHGREVDGDRGRGVLAEIRAVLAPIETELWDEADGIADADPAAQRAWAVGVWPRVEAGLAALGT